MSASLAVFVEGVNTFVETGLALLSFTLNVAVFPRVGINYRFKGGRAETASIVRVYTRLTRLGFVPLGFHLIWQMLCHDRFGLATFALLMFAFIEHGLLTVVSHQHSKHLSENEEIESPDVASKYVMKKIVAPLSDVTRFYATSGVFYFGVHTLLCSSSFLPMRIFGSLLWMSFFVGVGAGRGPSFDRKLDYFHQHWLWFFGLCSIPALLTELLCKYVAVVALPVVYHSALSIAHPPESSVSPFRWAGWAVDSTNWMLKNLTATRPICTA